MLSIEDIEGIVGTKCGKLEIVEYVGFFARNSKKKRHWYKCQCECGNIVYVDRTHLNGNTNRMTVSCGCARNKHGYHKHPAYINYKCMISRVRRPNPKKNKNYIINNIKVCKEWDGHPDVFCKWADENGFQKGLTLDRIDNNGNYCPENCRWADRVTQANNKMNTHYITYKGKKQSISLWSREIGIPVSTIMSRMTEGKMSFEEAILTPVNKKFSRKQKS